MAKPVSATAPHLAGWLVLALEELQGSRVCASGPAGEPHPAGKCKKKTMAAIGTHNNAHKNMAAIDGEGTQGDCLQEGESWES